MLRRRASPRVGRSRVTAGSDPDWNRRSLRRADLNALVRVPARTFLLEGEERKIGIWLARVARRIGEAGVTIELAYTTFGAVRLVLGVDDLDRPAPPCWRPAYPPR
jgi:hypothetical protein